MSALARVLLLNAGESAEELVVYSIESLSPLFDLQMSARHTRTLSFLTQD
jgi:hypothetical protein